MRQQQAELFLWFVGFGVICGLIYDLLRAFRKEVKHARAAVTLEDTLYGALVCGGCYGLFFWKNQGALRAYGFIGFFCGMTLYFLTVSRWVQIVFQWCFKALLLPVRWVLPKCKKWKTGRKSLTNRPR